MKKFFCLLVTLLIFMQCSFIMGDAASINPHGVTGSMGSFDELQNTLDGKPETSWGDKEKGAYIDYEFVDITRLTSLGIKWSDPKVKYDFKLEYSVGIVDEAVTYETVFTGSSLDSSDMQICSFVAIGAKNLRITATGDTGLDIIEVEFNPAVTSAPTPTPTPTPDPEKQDEAKKTAELPADVVGTKYENQLLLLKKLGIMEISPDVNFEPTSAVTRADFIKLLVKTIGFNPGTGSSQAFPDVPEGHSAFNEINFAHGIGLVVGGSDGNFMPENNVTYPQAVKQAVNMLGYSVVAESKGGYPGGYLMTGSEAGLLKGITDYSDKPIMKADAAMMCYNILHTTMFEALSFGGNRSIRYEKTTKFMEYYLDLYQGSGRVTRTNFTGLYDSQPVKEGWIQISDSANKLVTDGFYKLSDLKVYGLLGYNVKYYYFLKPDENPELVFASINDSYTSGLSILYENLYAADTGVITYYGRDKKLFDAKIAANCNVIVNGVYDGNFKLSEIGLVFDGRDPSGKVIRKEGNISLIGDGGNTYDTIIISAYDDYVVDTVNLKDNIIMGMYEPNSVLDLSDMKPDIDYRIFKNNEYITINEIKKMNVLSVMKTNNDKCEIIVSSDNIRGEVSSVVDTGELIINDKEYTLTRALMATTKFNPGDAGMFYLNFMGKIAGATRQSSVKTGVLVGIQKAKGSVDPYKANILTQDGKLVIFELAGAVNLTYKDGRTARIQPANGGLIGSGQFWDDTLAYSSRRLIKYETNSKGEIFGMHDAIENGNIYDKYSGGYVNPDGSKLVEIANSRKTGYTGRTTFRFKVSSYSFGVVDVGLNQFYAGDDTIVFAIPYSETETADIGEPNDYRVLDMSALRDGADYDMIAYTIDDTMTAQYIVIREKPLLMPSMHASSVPLLITKFVDVVDEDGEKKIKMYALREGSEVSYILKDERVITNRVVPKEADGSTYLRVTNARGGNYDIGFAMSTEIGLATTVADSTGYALFGDASAASDFFHDKYLPKLFGGITKNRVMPGDVVHIVLDPHTNEVASMTITFDGSRPRTTINPKTGINIDYQAKGLFFIYAHWDSDQSMGFNAGNQRIFGKVVSKRGNYIVLETNYSLRRQQVVYVPYDISGAKAAYCEVKATPAASYTYKESLTGPDITVSGGTVSHLLRGAEGPGNDDATTPVEDFRYTTMVVGSSGVTAYKKISNEEIKVGDEVFMRQFGSDVRDIIVYKWN